jgi:hypothetical protein
LAAGYDPDGKLGWSDETGEIDDRVISVFRIPYDVGKVGETHPRWDVRLKRIVIPAGKGRPTVAPQLERAGEPGFQELAQFRCSFELRNGIQFFECGCERIGETPDRPRSELLVFGLEIQVMHRADEVLWSFESSLNGLGDGKIREVAQMVADVIRRVTGKRERGRPF